LIEKHKKFSDFSNREEEYAFNTLENKRYQLVCSKIRKPEQLLHSTVDDEDEEPKFFSLLPL